MPPWREGLQKARESVRVRLLLAPLGASQVLDGCDASHYRWQRLALPARVRCAVRASRASANERACHTTICARKHLCEEE